MGYTQTISKASVRPLNKTSRNIRKRRDRRIETLAVARERRAVTDTFTPTPHCAACAGPLATRRHFDDVVMTANDAATVTQEFRALPPGTDLACELGRAIDARYKRLENEMGFAITGLPRMVCLGALCMSAISLGLALSGLHLGFFSFVCGASVLALFIALAVLTYCYNCVVYRRTTKGRMERARHREVLKALRALCKEQGITSDKAARVKLDGCISAIDGNVWFVTKQVVQGTILKPLWDGVDSLRRKFETWLGRRRAAAMVPSVSAATTVMTMAGAGVAMSKPQPEARRRAGVRV